MQGCGLLWGFDFRRIPFQACVYDPWQAAGGPWLWDGDRSSFSCDHLPKATCNEAASCSQAEPRIQLEGLGKWSQSFWIFILEMATLHLPRWWPTKPVICEAHSQGRAWGQRGASQRTSAIQQAYANPGSNHPCPRIRVHESDSYGVPSLSSFVRSAI